MVQHKATPIEERGNPFVDRAVNSGRDQFSQFVAMQTEMLKANQDLAAEMMRFAMRRLEARTAFLGRLAGCKSVEDLTEAQAEFWDGVRGDYKTEFDTLSTTVKSALDRLRPEGSASGSASARMRH